MRVINVGMKDVLWTYISVFFQKIGSGLILLPFILRKFSQETLGIWIIFLTVIGLTVLFDFGFGPSFARNISYVFSGASILKKNGLIPVKTTIQEVDYSLLKGLIYTMNKFYARLAWIFLVILSTIGTYYIFFILKNYSENLKEIYISWIIISFIASYSLYTSCLDILLFGKGLIMRSSQIDIFCQIIYLMIAIAIILILKKSNLLAIVCARVISVLVSRYLSYKTIYTKEFKKKLKKAVAPPIQKEIFKIISPNAIKIGLTNVGGFCINQFATLIGPFYLSLDEMASYGITQQIIGLISALANAYYSVYQPKNLQYRIQDDTISIKWIYLRGVFLMLLIFFIFGSGLLYFGQLIFDSLGSQTHLLSKGFIAIALLIAILETNHSNSAWILLTKNEVPFFRTSLFSGAISVILLFIFFQFFKFGIWAIILAPGFAQAVYQNWKWPLEVFRDLKIKRQDIFHLILEQIGMGRSNKN